jgi:hypothetical protein
LCLVPSSEDVAAEVLVFDYVVESARDVVGVDYLVLRLKVWAEEAYLVQDLLHDRVQASRADVLGLLVDADGEAREGVDGVFREVKLDAFGFEQSLVLL